MKKFFFILLLSLSCFVSLANHTKGGWMYYEYLGPGSSANTLKYKVVLLQYMICNPNSGQLDQQVNFTFYTGASNDQLYQTISAPLVSNPNIQNCPGCDPCIVNKPNICYKYATYETTTELPVNANGYTISYQRCCRISGIVNIVSPSSTVGDTWTIKIPGTVNGPLNSSPKFVPNDTAVICANNFFTFNFAATDPDGDVLVYDFAPAYTGATSGSPNPQVADPPSYPSIPYTSPFSAFEPLGSQVTINHNTGEISGIAPAIGEYVVTVVVQEYRNGVYIGESRKSLHIQVASCNLVAAELLPDNACDGFTKTFKNNLPDPPGASFSWDFGVPGNTTDVSNLQNPTYTYPDTGTYKVTLVISLNGACTDTATALVKVYPKLDPLFTTTGQCKNTAIQFTDKTQTTYGAVNSWSWNFGDTGAGNTSALQNPQHTFSVAGNYNVTLTVSNSKGCVSGITQTVTIKDKPDLLVTNDTLICSIDTLQLSAVGAGTIFWTPGYNINNQNNSSPLVSPDVPTKYYVTLTDPFGCKATDSVFVDVKLFVTIDAGRDTGICAGDAIQLNPISDALHYQWSPSASLDNAIIKNPTATPFVTTKFYVIGNIGKCQATDSVIVRVAPYPGAGGIPDTAICFGNSVQLNESGGSMYTWSPAFFLNNPDIPNPIASPDRSIRYIVTIRDTLGCPKPVFDTVVVMVQQVTADAGPRDTSIVENQPLQLNATGGEFYLWVPTTGLNNPAIANPVAAISDNIDYVVSVSTSAGCFDTDTISVKVYKVLPGIYVPNAFTPGSDGKNDLFRPIAIGMKQITYFKVFNRWGVLVYSSNQTAYEQNIGWDGTYKGRPQDAAVYVWIVEGVDYLDKKIIQKGTVTLIR
ncbi:MAG: domain containing protein [Chitinophagaceae bacterium]|nr:domain containing protein [Chitinophagaceae bacterium]